MHVATAIALAITVGLPCFTIVVSEGVNVFEKSRFSSHPNPPIMGERGFRSFLWTKFAVRNQTLLLRLTVWGF